MLTHKTTILFRGLLAGALVAIFFLATTRLRIPIADSINDKVNHIAAFYTLALLVDFSFPANDFRPKVFALLAYGLAIEITQSFLPYRSCSLYDLGADVIGLFAYGVSQPWFKHVPLLRRRWDADDTRPLP